MFYAAPMLGSRSLPVQVRVLLALLLAWVIYPSLEPMPSINAFSFVGILITIEQVLLGAAMGFLLQLVFAAMVVAGQTTATTMGLGFASTIDPQNGVQVPVLSQYFLILSTLMFFSLNGHLVLIETLVESFIRWPVSAHGFSDGFFWQIVSWIKFSFEGAMLIALPAISAVLLVNIAFGVMTRAAPQLNIFAVGFPITISTGFLVLMLTLPAFLPRFESLLEAGFLQMLTILER